MIWYGIFFVRMLTAYKSDPRTASNIIRRNFEIVVFLIFKFFVFVFLWEHFLFLNHILKMISKFSLVCFSVTIILCYLNHVRGVKLHKDSPVKYSKVEEMRKCEFNLIFPSIQYVCTSPWWTRKKVRLQWISTLKLRICQKLLIRWLRKLNQILIPKWREQNSAHINIPLC